MPASEHRSLKELVVVVPVYNETGNIERLYQKTRSILQPLKLRLSFIFVDDGSTDGTLDLLNRLADQNPDISVLSLSRNFGHQAALTAGLDYADAEVVITMDGDLQHPPETIPEMIRHYEAGSEIVYAVRQGQEHSGLARRLASGLYYYLLETIANVPVIRDAADFRLMSRMAVQAFRSLRETHRYMRGMVPWLGFPHAVIYYQQNQRYSGKPAYTWRKSLRLALDGLFSFSTVPIQLVTWMGLFLTFLSGLYLLFVIISRLQGNAVEGWTSVIGVVLIMSGVQLIAFGVIAQYIGMVFEQVKDRPLYILKQHRMTHNRKRDDVDSAS